MLSDVAVKYEKNFDQIHSMLHNMNTRHMRMEIRITNLVVPEGTPLVEACQAFFRDLLKITISIPILEARQLKGEPGPIIVKLAKREHKKLIFDNAKNLKGQLSRNGKHYGISSNLPEKENELDYRKRQIIRENKALPIVQQHKVVLKKGNLTVDGVPYQDLVNGFSVNDILAEDTDLRQYAKATYSTSSALSKDGSSFKAFAANVYDRHDVIKVYRHLKLRFLKSTHVMMGYWLPGNNKAYDEGYCNDGEHGGGRHLLRIMKDADLLSVLLVVVREYGGVHLGPSRFDLITSAANEALTKLRGGDKASHQLPLIASPKFETVRRKQTVGPIRPHIIPLGASPRLTNPAAQQRYTQQLLRPTDRRPTEG